MSELTAGEIRYEERIVCISDGWWRHKKGKGGAESRGGARVGETTWICHAEVTQNSLR